MTNVINQNSEALEWRTINWCSVNRIVNNLRQRIYRASVASDLKKVRSLQKLMLKARANRLLAIRRVTQINRGRNTPGVDNVTVSSEKGREILYRTLNNSVKENTCPVRRIYIPKKNGKKRPLGIPVIADRCRQAIVKSALEPFWEAKFEAVSYGFRPGRGAHDAIQKIHCITRARGKRHWVLDADISGAFDNIDHEFLLKVLDGFPAKGLISQWLKAGVMENKTYHATRAGTPQGGVISPLLANIALHGMETLLGIEYWKNGKLKQDHPYAVVRYADDFVIFAKSQEECEEAKTKLKVWLKTRGLQLSEEKTSIKHLQEGFDFLGFNIRHYKTRHKKRGYMVLIKPSKASVRQYRQEMRHAWRSIIGIPAEEGIKHLNAKVTGWCNYFRIGVSSKIFGSLDHWMWKRQVRYLYRRHPNKHWWWWREHYFGKVSGRNDRWVFMDRLNGVFLWKHAWTKIRRHTMVTGGSSPDNPELREYWKKRQERKQPFIYGVRPVLHRVQKGCCPVCKQDLDNEEMLHVHHVILKSQGGNNRLSNLRLLHSTCHRQIHSTIRYTEVSKLPEPYAG